MPIVFNGRAFAKEKEIELAGVVSGLQTKIRVKTFTFREDQGSALYTRLKSEAAGRIGISYEAIECSIKDSQAEIIEQIFNASKDPQIAGVMVQKPAKSVFMENFPNTDFNDWWEKLTNAIDPKKDVDCLTKKNLIALSSGEKVVLPATVKAVISILEHAKTELNISQSDWKQKRVAIIGRSDIVGKPLSWVLKDKFNRVELFGRENIPNDLKAFDIVVSAAGKPNLISEMMIEDGIILVDVGAPKGDVDFENVVSHTAFITPVPGGVGPVTVISLMENIVQIFSGE
jgi:methylenetetrahydrofolate dehydrogenase (NADP+) / methenyltetrahydrofolate cyclohydrolase